MTAEAVDLAVQVDGQLATAGSYEDYHRLVRDLNVAYGRIDQNSADLACFHVIVPLAGVVDQYTMADDVWRQCNNDYYCDSANAQTRAQRHWSKAGRQLEKARMALSE